MVETIETEKHELVYSFPIAAEKNCHDFKGFYIMSFLPYSSVAEKSEISFPGLKSRCWQARVPPGPSRGEFISFVFQCLEADLTPWLV